LRLLLVYNLKRDNRSAEEAEFDSIETINSIREAMECRGNEVTCVEENDDFYDSAKALKNSIDLVFNIAEGRKGSFREASVPFILELLDMPYTASDPRTLMLALDKNLCNILLRTNGVTCPGSVVLNTEDMDRIMSLRFPVIVKPNCEGSSKGINGDCVYDTFDEVIKNLDKYKLHDSTYMAEEYIEGREFTAAALISIKETTVFRPMEVIFRNKNRHNVYGFDIKKTGDRYVEFDYDPELSVDTEDKMKQMTKKVISVLGVRDLARLDFRLTKDNVPYFIEINPLPGLAKGYSDFPNICRANGMDYEELIDKIIKNANERMRLLK
jgi:D-alanine-D-alanine ligase